MTSIILINKQGIIKETKIKQADPANFYKKCGFKKPDGFDIIYSITNSELPFDKIELWGKKSGYAKMENKYPFSQHYSLPPIYGTCLIIGYIDGKPVSINKEHWETINKPTVLEEEPNEVMEKPIETIIESEFSNSFSETDDTSELQLEEYIDF